MAFKSTVQRMLAKAKGTSPDDQWPYLKERYDLAAELRRPYEQRWQLNLSFLAGKQYTFYNENAFMIQHLIAQKGRLRVVDNKILPRYQKQVSRMIRNQPRMSVVPASTDQEDLKAAKKGDKILKWYWRQHQMKKKVRTLSGWIYSCGNGYLGDTWNPRLGPMIVGKDGSLLYEGDAEVEVWSPFDVGVPSIGLGDTDIESMPWIEKHKFRTLEQIQTEFERGKLVEAQTRPMPYVDSSLLFGLGESSSARKVDGAVVIELRVKPNSEFPKGLFLIGANGRILEKEDYPYESYHLQQFKDIEVPGVFHGMATTEAAIWLQKIWNRTLSDIADYNRTMARGKWLIPRNAKLEVVPDDSHGQRFEYNPVLGHKPEMMTIKGLPASYQQALNTVAASLMELYHQHEVTSGTNKSDIRSGEMVALLLEQDDFGNVPTHAVFEEGMEAVFSRILRRIQKGYKRQRVIAVTGRDDEHEVFAFEGADLRNNTDVAVAKESSIPDSKVARQFRITTNYKDGLYGSPEDPRTRERVLRMLDEVPDDVKDIFAEDHLDRQIQLIENQAMMAQPGITLIANPYDNHGIHLEQIRIQRKQPEYQRMKMEDPAGFGQMEMTFISHEQQHQAFFAEQQKSEDARMAKMAKMEKGGRG